MEELLNNLIGKKIDVSCGGSAVYRGLVTGMNPGLLLLKDDDGKLAFIAVDKITVVCECSESSTRPGFIV